MQGRVSKHFTWHELTYSNTAARRGIRNIPSPEAAINLKRLAEAALEPARVHFGRPMSVNSGYRGPALNAAIGGSKTSNHMIGAAADVTIRGVPAAELCRWLAENMDVFDEVIAERISITNPAQGWCHIAIRPPGTNANRKKVLTWWGPGKGYERGIAV